MTNKIETYQVNSNNSLTEPPHHEDAKISTAPENSVAAIQNTAREASDKRAHIERRIEAIKDIHKNYGEALTRLLAGGAGAMILAIPSIVLPYIFFGAPGLFITAFSIAALASLAFALDNPQTQIGPLRKRFFEEYDLLQQSFAECKTKLAWLDGEITRLTNLLREPIPEGANYQENIAEYEKAREDLEKASLACKSLLETSEQAIGQTETVSKQNLTAQFTIE